VGGARPAAHHHHRGVGGLADMHLVRIDLDGAIPAHRRRAITDAIHDALEVSLAMPPHDRLQIITTHPPMPAPGWESSAVTAASRTARSFSASSANATAA
jgi:hypothetical protein